MKVGNTLINHYSPVLRLGTGLLAGGLLCWIGPFSALAQSGPRDLPARLDLESSLVLAIGNNPALKAAQWQIQAREAEGLQAGRLSNPELELEVENIAGSGEFSGTDAAEYTVMVSQELPLGGKRSKQRGLSGAERRLAEWALEGAKRDLARDVKVAYAEVLASQSQAAIAEELVKLADELLKTARRRVASGAASVLEESKAGIEKATLEAGLMQVKQHHRAARQSFALILGVPLTKLPPVEGDLGTVSKIPPFQGLKSKLADNPYYHEKTAELDKLDAALQLENSRNTPDINLGLGWKRDEEAASDAFIFAVGLPLPLFDRNQGGRQAVRYERAAAEEDTRSVSMQMERELANYYSDVDQAYTQARILKDEILSAAQQSFEVSREGYLGGRFAYIELLDAQRTLFDIRTQYIETLKRYHQAKAEVERLTGDKHEPTQ